MKPLTRVVVVGLSITHVFANVIQGVLGSPATSHWSLGNDYSLLRTKNGVQVSDSGNVIWTAELPFISASGGHDNVTESSGAFIIEKVDENKCQGQEISTIEQVDVPEAVDETGIQLAGSLSGCGDATASYNFTLYVPADLSNRVAFEIDVSSDQDLQKIYLRFGSDASEDFYGLGAQASFASLKNQSVPIFTREQGVGRGDQPVTRYENE